MAGLLNSHTLAVESMSERTGGRFEVVRCLGSGTMATVYLCRHRELAGAAVALKVLFPELARDETFCTRFRDELTASYAVSHPNVVRSYEYFRDGDFVGLTMEYVDGGDLSQLMEKGPIPITHCIELLTDIADGLSAVHAAGIIHRDLKAENILITSDGRAKIADFGIARSRSDLNSSDAVVGCIDYVPPEYLEDGTIDFCSDVYAIGLLAYEMITGQLPFEGESLIETMNLRLRGVYTEPKVLNRACPARLSDLVVRAMERDPARRFATAAEMKAELLALKSA